MKRYYKWRFNVSHAVATPLCDALNHYSFVVRSMRVSQLVATVVATVFDRGTGGSSRPAAGVHVSWITSQFARPCYNNVNLSSLSQAP